MILTDEQIKKAVSKKHADYQCNVKYERELDIFVNGIDYVGKLLQISNLENDTQALLRKKYAISTKPLAENVLRHIDKVFSAKGGSYNFNFNSNTEKNETELAQILNTVCNGKSVDFFMQNVWAKKWVDSPRSVIMIELDSKKGAYPIFVKSNFIYNWEMKDINHYEWILIYEQTIQNDNQTIEIYRLIDDAYDYNILKYSDTDIRIVRNDITIQGIELKTIPNYWGEVPCIQFSDYISSIDLTNKISILDPVLELFSNYLLDNSILRIYKFLHGYPYFWYVEDICGACGGTGHDIEGECPVCHGSGNRKKKDVSDGRAIRQPESTDVNILPNVAGYIQPAIETWTKMNEDIANMKTEIHYTVWGTYVIEDSRYQTALGRLLDSQPVNDKLTGISRTAQSVHQWIVEMIGRYNFQDSFESAVIMYGNDYLLETSDELFEKYKNARSSGVCERELTNILTKYYTTQFQTNPTRLKIALKKIDFEPYPHAAIDYVEKLSISDDLKDRKRYFYEFLKTLTDTQFLQLDLKTFNKLLDNYIKENYDDEEQEGEQSDAVQTNVGVPSGESTNEGDDED